MEALLDKIKNHSREAIDQKNKELLTKVLNKEITFKQFYNELKNYLPNDRDNLVAEYARNLKESLKKDTIEERYDIVTGFTNKISIEDAQEIVDEYIEKFGRVGAGLLDDLDQAGYYVDNDNKVQLKVKEEKITEDLESLDYDKLRSELEAIPNVTKVDFDKDLIYDTHELVVLVS